MKGRNFAKVMNLLIRTYRPRNWASGRDPFDVLVSIVVSQNSTDAVTEKVMQLLRRKVDVTPQGIVEVSPRVLESILCPAGLAGQKVPRLRAAAREIISRYNGNLRALTRMRTERAREALTSLPGIGPKTADVWLSLVANRPTVPVDTHIARLARRWKLTRSNRYDDVANVLRRLIPSRERLDAHLALIQFGRDICKARRPRCRECLVYDLCDADERLPQR